MKRKLLVLLIVLIPIMMPNMATAIAIDVGDLGIAWNSLLVISSCENDSECFGDNCWCGQGNGDF